MDVQNKFWTPNYFNIMYSIDDPMFALILRFVGHNQKIFFCNQNFIKKQLKAIQEHIEKFPPEEKELRAIEWIEKCARQYRKIWEKEIITDAFSKEKCPDCPLSEINNLKICRIHDQWLKLFQQYAINEIDSKQYIESNLKLLAEHKEHLKIKLSELK
ncbi:hypothetical protein PN36_17275 [Candidatus Thiomargarita nelsonii]|uniref:Uncharacterized protein n=1 Tax=Candidatus Thiomargarita nelsonii TaxID=1003181 RepID=A0A0A6RQZ8_9GAMM|nr:hypothetical protein PN36_17275 [Candidatus Thiomargarita nelsonii]